MAIINTKTNSAINLKTNYFTINSKIYSNTYNNDSNSNITINNTIDDYLSTNNIVIFDDQLFRKRSLSHICGYWLESNADENHFHYTAIVNTVYPDSGPIFIN